MVTSCYNIFFHTMREPVVRTVALTQRRIHATACLAPSPLRGTGALPGAHRGLHCARTARAKGKPSRINPILGLIPKGKP